MNIKNAELEVADKRISISLIISTNPYVKSKSTSAHNIVSTSASTSTSISSSVTVRVSLSIFSISRIKVIIMSIIKI